MANYSDIFPLTTGGGGGSTSIAGFEWSEKTSDFTAESNKAYYCDTALGDILLTLPPNPSPGDEIAFFLIGSNKVYMTTTAKIKGYTLAQDFVKTTSENYTIFILFYADSVTGWDWNNAYDQKITEEYIGSGITLPYTNSSTFDGLANFLGTNSLTQAWSNPCPSRLNLFSEFGSYAPTSPTLAFDRVLNTGNYRFYVSLSGGRSIRLDLFNNKKINPSKILWNISDVSSPSGQWKWQGWTGTTWEDLTGFVSFPSSAGNRVFDLTSINFYSSLRFYLDPVVNSALTAFPFGGINEMEIWGVVI